MTSDYDDTKELLYTIYDKCLYYESTYKAILRRDLNNPYGFICTTYEDDDCTVVHETGTLDDSKYLAPNSAEYHNQLFRYSNVQAQRIPQNERKHAVRTNQMFGYRDSDVCFKCDEYYCRQVIRSYGDYSGYYLILYKDNECKGFEVKTVYMGKCGFAKGYYGLYDAYTYCPNTHYLTYQMKDTYLSSYIILDECVYYNETYPHIIIHEIDGKLVADAYDKDDSLCSGVFKTIEVSLNGQLIANTKRVLNQLLDKDSMKSVLR